MSSLIKNELIKIFKKKSIYITLIVVLAFMIFMNIMYKNTTTYYSYGGYTESDIELMEAELQSLDPNNPADMSTYIEIQTQIESARLQMKYEGEDWKLSVIGTQILPYINEKNTLKYGVEKNEEEVKRIENTINGLLERLDQDDWRYFANIELQEVTQNLENLEKQKETTVDKQELKNLENSIESAKIDKEVKEYRINEDIKYGNDYLNQALSEYGFQAKQVLEYENSEKELKYSEKQQYQNALEAKEISRYIIENKIDVYKTDSLKYVLENFFNNFGIFILVIVVMIAGTIVSEEFNKGTIKLLLVKPYSRNKILLSKLLTTFIMIAFVIAVVLIMEIIVGGITFGFDSISEPTVVYNFNTQSIQEINIFAYVGIEILTQLPMIILLGTLAFAISTIFTNSALAITISLLGYMSTMFINQLAIIYDIKILKYFVTMNWDLTPYLFGGLGNMEGMSMPMSIIICIVYFILIAIPTFWVMKKRNIKNI